MVSALGSDDDRDSPRRRRRLHFSLRQLQAVYHLPLKLAAQRLGICEAALKRICRRHRILKWPYRQLSSVRRRIADLRTAERALNELGCAGNHLRRHESRPNIHATERLHASIDNPEPFDDQAQLSPTTSKMQEAKMRALIDEHRRIVHSAHLDTDVIPTAPGFQSSHAKVPHPSTQRKSLAIGASIPPPSLLALASACEIHAVARQHQRRYQECSYQTARLLGLAPTHTALHDLAVVASSIPRAFQHAK